MAACPFRHKRSWNRRNREKKPKIGVQHRSENDQRRIHPDDTKRPESAQTHEIRWRARGDLNPGLLHPVHQGEFYSYLRSPLGGSASFCRSIQPELRAPTHSKLVRYMATGYG